MPGGAFLHCSTTGTAWNRLPESPSVDTTWPGGYNRMMEIGYDPAKRDKPLKERRLDFEDIRKDYDKRRWVTIGFLSGRIERSKSRSSWLPGMT